MGKGGSKVGGEAGQRSGVRGRQRKGIGLAQEEDQFSLFDEGMTGGMTRGSRE